MQAILMGELRAEYPDARIVREENFIDVLVETSTTLDMYEIKSDLAPRTVLRAAIGQLLEYAFFRPERCTRKLRLVIVGRNPLGREEAAYLQHLRTTFSLPLDYRVVAI